MMDVNFKLGRASGFDFRVFKVLRGKIQPPETFGGNFHFSHLIWFYGIKGILENEIYLEVDKTVPIFLLASMIYGAFKYCNKFTHLDSIEIIYNMEIRKV